MPASISTWMSTDHYSMRYRFANEELGASLFRPLLPRRVDGAYARSLSNDAACAAEYACCLICRAIPLAIEPQVVLTIALS
jgi:hypothetical protein